MKTKYISLYFIVIVFTYMLSQYNYLLFHTIIEIFTIFIGIGMFVFAITKLKSQSNKIDSFYIFLGIMFGGISMIDLIHTLVYKGMNIIPELTSNHATQLWIIARFIESIILLVAATYYNKIKKISVFKVIGINIIIIFISIIVVFIFKIFPDCYIDSKGLTDFKKISEYVIIAILLIVIFIFKRKKEILEKEDYFNFQLAIIMTIFSEFMFTLYMNVYGISNMLGHLFKLMAFILIYKSILKNLLILPFEKINIELEQANKKIEEKLEETLENYEELLEEYERMFKYAINMSCIAGFDGYFKILNPAWEKTLGWTNKELLSKPFIEFIHFEDIAATINAAKELREGKDIISFENRYICKNGEYKWLLWSSATDLKR